MKNKKLTLLGLYISLALILSFIESILPPIIPISGVKLGISNLVILIVLVNLSTKDAFYVFLGKIILSSIFIGQGMTFFYSFTGGLLSFICMLLLLKILGVKHILFISIFGGLSHNLGQLLVAYILLQSYSLLYYIPVLFLSGSIMGALLGILYQLLSKRIPKL